MTDHADDNGQTGGSDDAPRVRFKGIVESDLRATAPYGAAAYLSGEDRRWNSMSRQIWQMAPSPPSSFSFR